MPLLVYYHSFVRSIFTITIFVPGIARNVINKNSRLRYRRKAFQLVRTSVSHELSPNKLKRFKTPFSELRPSERFKTEQKHR
jgi:hypothetical protein